MSPTVRLVNIGGQVRISKTPQTDDEKAKESSPPSSSTEVPAKPVAIPITAPSKICDTVAPSATPSSASPKKPSRASSTVSPSPVQLSSDSESDDDDDEGDDEDEDDEDEEEDEEDDSLSTSSSVTSKTAAPSANSTLSNSSVKSGSEILAAQQRLSPSPNPLTANLPSMMRKTSKRLFACNVCGKECRNESDLSLHKKRHKVDQPFVCQFCDREYVDKSR